MKTIFLSFQQAGGANALYPLIQELYKKEYRLIIVGREPACTALRKQGISCMSYDDVSMSEDSLLETLKDLFVKTGPDILITDTIDLERTGWGFICRHFWQWARQRNIPSIAYMDCWWGFKRRFAFAHEKKLTILPDKIAVVDEYAREMIIDSGLPKACIVITGSPRFEKIEAISRQVRRDSSETDSSAVQSLKKKWGLSRDHFVMAFASQPIEKTFGGHSCGFTEKTTLIQLINALNELPDEVRNRLVLLILLHPEETRSDIEDLLKKKAHRIRITIPNNFSSEILLACDVVTGMSSIFLLEALIMKRPVLSLQPGLRMEEILITNITGATRCITDETELITGIQNAVISEDFRRSLIENQANFQIISPSVSRWIDLVNQTRLI